MRFERKTNEPAQYLAIPFFGGYLWFIIWVWSKSNLEGLFPFALFLVLTCAGVYGLINCIRKLVFPYTVFLELNGDEIVSGIAERASESKRYGFKEIRSIFLNGEDGYITLVDDLGKTRIFAIDLYLRNVELEEIRDHLLKFIEPDQLVYRPFIGAQLGRGPNRTTEIG